MHGGSTLTVKQNCSAVIDAAETVCMTTIYSQRLILNGFIVINLGVLCGPLHLTPTAVNDPDAVRDHATQFYNCSGGARWPN
jgi:hypothetical protein